MILNNRFRLDGDRNLLTDLPAQETHKLEPRVMKVMLYLAARTGQVVTREELVDKLWDNYGGAEDALTQAISTLRKACSDESKTLIRTVPKKGYVLDAVVNDLITPENLPSTTAAQPRSTPRFRPVYLWVALVVIIMMLFRLFKTDSYQEQKQQVEPQADSATIEREKAEQKLRPDSAIVDSL